MVMCPRPVLGLFASIAISASLVSGVGATPAKGRVASPPKAVRSNTVAPARAAATAPSTGYTASEFPGVFVRNVPEAAKPATGSGLVYKLPDGVTTPVNRRIQTAPVTPSQVVVRKSTIPGTDLIAYLGDAMMVPIVARKLPSGDVVIECEGQPLSVTPGNAQKVVAK